MGWTVSPTLRHTVWAVLRRRPAFGIGALVGSVMHAAGHAFLAGAAGMLAQALAKHGSGMDVGSTRPALALALAGVVAAIVKLVGSATASWAEARIAGEAASSVRLAVLDRVLALDAEPGHLDHGGVHGRKPLRTEGTPKADRRPERRATSEAGRDGRSAQMAALTAHIHDVERGVAYGIVAEVRSIIALVPLAVLLVVLAPRLAGTAVVALVGFGVLAFTLRRAFKRAHRRAAGSAEALVAAADEAVKHAELWATYGAARRIRAHVAGIGRAIAHEGAAVRVRGALLSSTSEVLGALSLALVLYLAARGLFGVDQATVVPFAIVFFMTYKPLRDLVEARLERSRGEAALQAAWVGEPKATAPAKRTCAWKPAELRLNDVETAYGGHAPLNMTIPGGSIVAVVGPTGSGKTSLLRALLGLDPLKGGAVTWNGARIDTHGVGPGERPFAWVPQDAPIVGDTLAINVGLGRADDDARVPDPRPYLARLGAGHLAAQLGDDILAAKRPLSGGERQWIAVARALASGQPALLLDEPTSALDLASEEKLLAAIARLKGELTIVIVTHRPAPLAIADQVLDLNQIERRSGGDDERVGPQELAVRDERA